MLIRSTLIAFLMASGSLYADLLNSSSMTYSYAGTISHGGDDIKSDSVSGTGFDYDYFTISGGPDGLTYELGGETLLTSSEGTVNFLMRVSYQTWFTGHYPSTFDTSIEVTLDLSSATYATFTFDSPMLTGEYSGTSLIQLNGNEVATSGSGFLLNAGSHTFTFELDGGNTGVKDEYGVFSVEVNIETIPEPGTWALLVGGAGLLALARRKRRA